MKKIIFSQRVEIIEGYGERRDCADQHISEFIKVCGFLPVPIMNNPLLVSLFCDEICPDGFILTGGNDLCTYGGNAPERDKTERLLLEYAIKHDIPVLGICRGMQMIADYYGAELKKVNNHIRVNHRVAGLISRKTVNSFHGMAIKEVHKPLKVVSTSEDGVTESIMHESDRVAAIMWHPERVEGFDTDDIALISRFLNGGNFV